jgi:hypothetical protein
MPDEVEQRKRGIDGQESLSCGLLSSLCLSDEIMSTKYAHER